MWWSYVRRVWEGANFNGWEGLALPSLSPLSSPLSPPLRPPFGCESSSEKIKGGLRTVTQSSAMPAAHPAVYAPSHPIGGGGGFFAHQRRHTRAERRAGVVVQDSRCAADAGQKSTFEFDLR